MLVSGETVGRLDIILDVRLFRLVEFFLGDSLEMVGHLVVRMGETVCGHW